MVDFKLYDGFNGRHRAETVFIIGAGPQLAHLSDEYINELENRPTIGVNMTCYGLRLKYFLSAYIGQAILAKHVLPKSCLLHMRPQFEPALTNGIIPLRRMIFSEEWGLPASFSPPEPTLYTKNNVALGATHLAYIFGASQVVYIGVEQRNQLHFWHFDRKIQRRIRKDIEILRDIPFLTIDHPYSTYERQVEKIERQAEDCLQPFYDQSHEQTFRAYFSCLKSAGVNVVSTVQDSVVVDAGAPFIPLAEVLA